MPPPSQFFRCVSSDLPSSSGVYAPTFPVLQVCMPSPSQFFSPSHLPENDLLAEPLTSSRIHVLVTARPRRFPVNPRTCDHSCLAKVDVRPIFQERLKHFWVMYLNARSVGNKAPEVCDLIVEGNYDVTFLTETWLKTQGSEATIAELTPLGFSIKSMPRTTGTGCGVAVLYRNSTGTVLSPT
ncbi:hypothetical protein ACOMHN_003689 [Nucella lapillus]